MIIERAKLVKINGPIIEGLQENLALAMKKIVSPDLQYALLDFPNHFNVGDSAIYVGETILCRQHFGKDPHLVSEIYEDDLHRIERMDPSVVLLLHGGGNFGDLYPRHQIFRELVVSRFPDRKIVFLPQSIHYSDQRNLSQTQRILNGHPDLTIMVRDDVSYEFATKNFECSTVLVPDSAFMIGAVEPDIDPDLKVLLLLRDDKESIVTVGAEAVNLPQPAKIVDWPHDWQRKRKIDSLPRSIRAWLPPRVQGQFPVTPAGFEVLARKRVRRGFNILSCGEVIISDRLHAHILATLLGKPHLVLDNNYGKVGSFMKVWTTGVIAQQVSDLEEATTVAHQMFDQN